VAAYETLMSSEEDVHDVNGYLLYKYPQENIMETIIFAGVIVALAVAVIWYYNRDSRGADVNQDGRIDLDDAKQALVTTKQGLTQDIKDAQHLAASLVSESAARATAALEKVKSPRQTSTAKKTPAKPKTTKTPRSRAPRSNK
jgi:hypothetical protein